MSNPHSFIATTAGVSEDEDALVATLDSGADAYLMFQRQPELGHDDDDGVYVEIDDQCNAGTDIVNRCVVSEIGIVVTLTKPLKGYVELNATFDLPKTELVAFIAMLRRITIMIPLTFIRQVTTHELGVAEFNYTPARRKFHQHPSATCLHLAAERLT